MTETHKLSFFEQHAAMAAKMEDPAFFLHDLEDFKAFADAMSAKNGTRLERIAAATLVTGLGLGDIPILMHPDVPKGVVWLRDRADLPTG